MGMIGAIRETIATSNTSFRKELNLWTSMSSLWIMTPETSKRTTFKKNSGSNTRSVMDWKSL